MFPTEKIYVARISNPNKIEDTVRLKYESPLSSVQIRTIERTFSARFLPPVEDCGIYNIYMFEVKEVKN